MKLFIFDMGNVFLTGIAIIRNMAESIGIPEEALRSDYAEHEHALMDGSMLPEEYYRHLEDRFGIKVKVNPFLEFFRPSSDEKVLSVCDGLRSHGFRCAVGSNTFAPHWEYVKEMPSDPLFPGPTITSVRPCINGFDSLKTPMAALSMRLLSDRAYFSISEWSRFWADVRLRRGCMSVIIPARGNIVT